MTNKDFINSIVYLAYHDPFIFAQIMFFNHAIQVSIWLTNCVNIYNDSSDMIGDIIYYVEENKEEFNNLNSHDRVIFNVHLFENNDEPKICSHQIIKDKEV